VDRLPDPEGPDGLGPEGHETRSADGPDSHDDAPTGEWERPTDPFGERPTGEWERPTDPFGDAPTGEWDPPLDRAPVRELPEGSIMYHGDRPLTPAEARTMYENAIADSRHREVQIMENTTTGEQIVVQGGTAITQVDPAAAAEFLLEGRHGFWRVIRHNHTVGLERVTSHVNRYPTGSGGDLGRARSTALRTGRIQSEAIDIVTEHGAQEIHFGYDPGASRPFFVDLPLGPTGRDYHDFVTLESYHDWFEQQTGRRMPYFDRGD
jgi:hypothetical protein